MSAPGELGALEGGHLFCLADGNAPIEVMTESLLAAMPQITHAARRNRAGFWHIYSGGRIRRMWL